MFNNNDNNNSITTMINDDDNNSDVRAALADPGKAVFKPAARSRLGPALRATGRHREVRAWLLYMAAFLPCIRIIGSPNLFPEQQACLYWKEIKLVCAADGPKRAPASGGRRKATRRASPGPPKSCEFACIPCEYRRVISPCDDIGMGYHPVWGEQFSRLVPTRRIAGRPQICLTCSCSYRI